jgi:serine/threonine protein kinase
MPSLGSLFSGRKVDARLQRNQKLVDSMLLDRAKVLLPDQVSMGEMIGQGGFAKVFRCEVEGRGAVCKQINVEKLNDEMTYLLTNECTIWAKLAHRHIVLFHGMASTNTSIWLLCEFMPDGSLLEEHTRLKKARAAPPTELDLLGKYEQIASGMKYLHGLSPPVLHRDLKSANILLADFGLARILDNSNKKMTAETGSYRWMAPEVIRHEMYNERCDVYSFAILGWEMLTYQIPFDRLMPVEAAFAVAREARRPDMPSDPPPPATVQRMLEWCWQQDSMLRPSFAEVVEMLQKEIPGARDRLGAGGSPALEVQ